MMFIGNLQYKNEPIEQVHVYNYLRIEVDSDLSFEDQLKKMYEASKQKAIYVEQDDALRIGQNLGFIIIINNLCYHILTTVILYMTVCLLKIKMHF